MQHLGGGPQTDRKTSGDFVFETLYQQIMTLQFLPGTKLSEAEVARSFGLSRQPVREAFTRLADLNLLLVRPQRATVVRPFSRDLIGQSIFVRTAVELAVVEAAALGRDTSVDAALHANLEDQERAIAEANPASFHAHDYAFHRLLCDAAGRDFAFSTISANKAQADRLCLLSLTDDAAMRQLHADHVALFAAIKDGDAPKAEAILRTHLDRLTPTVDAVYASHRSFFE